MRIWLFIFALSLPLTLAVQTPVRFRDIPLGEPVKTTTAQIKKQGCKVVKSQDKEEDLFYGTHWEVFLLGEHDA